jgi:hypothetical protein
MFEVQLDAKVFVPKETKLDPKIKDALWDFVARIVADADHPDVIGKQVGEFRATQFTHGWILDWEVARRSTQHSSRGIPEQVKLWDIRGPFS